MTLPNFGYHFARLHGRVVRRIYRLLLRSIVRRSVNVPRALDFDVFAYSSQENLPEQVASIRSFLRHAGRPRKFTVLSDGSHTAESIGLLQRIDPCVRVEQASPPQTGVADKFSRYLATHPTGKQLALIMRLPGDLPAFYIDSDVLFFEGASDLLQRAHARDVVAYYLADCQFAGDERLLHDPAEKASPVNTGVLFLFQKLDWSLGAARFAELAGDPVFFTNQTLTHLAMHANKAESFDPSKYVLQLDDQCVYSDRYAGPKLALRHYVNPVRHKFWTSLNQ
jgi:hypothetical protein